MQISIEDIFNIIIICLVCGFFSTLLVDTIKDACKSKLW